jgi:hypothetical protein
MTNQSKLRQALHNSISNISLIKESPVLNKKSISSSSSHCSSPCNSTELHDYSSSSEISCDTVIFIEANGKRRFHKKPPACLLPQPPSASITTLKSTRLTQIPKLGVSVSHNSNKLLSSSSSSDLNEVWIDGPKCEMQPKLQSTPTKSLLTPPNKINLNEIWIDGPRATRAFIANDKNW